jgi:hypothetical protein
VHDIVVVTEDVGVTCDLLDSPTSEPHTTNMLCDKCKMSLMNDNLFVMSLKLLLRMKC